MRATDRGGGVDRSPYRGWRSVDRLFVNAHARRQPKSDGGEIVEPVSRTVRQRPAAVVMVSERA